MKLLILAQAVDREDQLFGFFVPWLEGARSVFSSLLVFALRVRPSSIPESVQVLSLKPRGTESRLNVAVRTLSLAWKYRHEYDGVFVRGDAIYLVLVGWLWRLLGKKVVFWYTHYKAGGWMFWLGSLFAHRIVTAAASANPLRSALVIGHHIPNTLIQPYHPPTSPLRLLILGRVSPVKQVPALLESLKPLLERNEVMVTIVGSAVSSAEAERVGAMVETMPNITWRQEGVDHAHISRLFSSHDVLVSATPNSLDKVLLEATLGGLFVIASSTAWNEILEGTSAESWGFAQSVESIPRILDTYKHLPQETQAHLVAQLQQRVQRLHGQAAHLEKLAAVFEDLLK